MIFNYYARRVRNKSFKARMGWLFGLADENNYEDTMLKVLGGDEPTVVEDIGPSVPLSRQGGSQRGKCNNRQY